MKDETTKILKDIASGSVKSVGGVAVSILLLLLAGVAMLCIPLLLLFGLKLMGLPVTIGLESFFGAFLITVFFWILRPKSKKDGNT